MLIDTKPGGDRVRPASIINFERLYLGVIVLGLVNNFLSWDRNLALLGAQPTIQFGPKFLLGTIAVGLIIQFLLWFFVARKGSVVAKWIFVLFTAAGLAFFLSAFIKGPDLSTPGAILTAVTVLLQVAAAWMLFRPDAAQWFGARGD
jgi:hypothetical protein